MGESEEEKAERARAEAEAIAKVSSGREYELGGEAGEAQSAALAVADLGGGDAQVERITGPHHAWLNLNPFHVLHLPHTVTEEDIKGRYKRMSALVHPDKCGHERANEAFQEVKKAYDTLLEPNKRRIAAGTIQGVVAGLKKVRRRVEAKLQSQGLFADLAALPPFDTLVATEVSKAFAEVEHRKRTYEERVKANAARELEEATAAHERAVEEAKADVAWAQGRDARVEQWRNFEHSAGPGGGGGGGGLKRAREEGGEGGWQDEDGAPIINPPTSAGAGDGGAASTGASGAAAAAAAALAAPPPTAPGGGSGSAASGVSLVGVRVSDTLKYGASVANNGGGGTAPVDEWKKRWR